MQDRLQEEHDVQTEQNKQHGSETKVTDTQAAAESAAESPEKVPEGAAPLDSKAEPGEETPAEDQGLEAETDWQAEYEKLSEELAVVTAEQNRIASAYTRLRADFENFRRRKNQEMDTISKKAVADFVRQLLPVIDNLERAVAAADEDEGALAEGVRLVLRQIMELLQAHGIEPIESVGQPFDPTWHEAVEQVTEAGDVEPGTVIDELQKGYRMGDLLLRPSMVRVAG